MIKLFKGSSNFLMFLYLHEYAKIFLLPDYWINNMIAMLWESIVITLLLYCTHARQPEVEINL